ncbi:MAG TPA: biopolymer transporter ExbD, partial [Saprospiraceae bacterium]|nr:biopolymer transporter ExbD [Saprospiraceae bacterium]
TDKRPVSFANLENLIKAKIKGKDPKTTTLTIVAEKTATVDYVVQVLDLAYRLQVKTILATDPKPQ